MRAMLSIDPSRCSRCGLCARMCPTRALTRGGDRQIRVHAERMSGCVACGWCLTACPRDAIRGTGIAPAGFPAVLRGVLASVRHRLGEVKLGRKRRILAAVEAPRSPGRVLTVNSKMDR
jgi:Fe-S-cluster-containing hydrogenase component 2